MSDYREVWEDAYCDARENGLSVNDASILADRYAQEWTERQIAKAEAMEDR